MTQHTSTAEHFQNKKQNSDTNMSVKKRGAFRMNGVKTWVKIQEKICRRFEALNLMYYFLMIIYVSLHASMD